MDKLDKIFSIVDIGQRQKELCEYAQSLNISLGKVKNERGEVDENKLAVLIYETKGSQVKRKKQIIVLIGIGMVVLTVGLAAIYVVSKVLAGLSGS